MFVGSDLPAEAAFTVVDMLGGTSGKVSAGATCTRRRVAATDVTALLGVWAAPARADGSTGRRGS
ncbi:hypothetical protein [Deinococcus pimensis]|uniref:hypothetical protein n=1 Tax=Deinococcus pimensis TaxID=309888 RepID=UPI0004815244|nr:hypothetical protein [Deinococcus pimensis]